jgi:virginiamycin A acetyltransferase
MKIDYIFNDKVTDIILEENVKLAHLSKIMQCSLKGNNYLGLGSCFNRSNVGKYVAMSYFSYLADCDVGNFCTIAARVSIGAFSHPTNFLTVHEVGYRNSIASYGETAYDSDSDIFAKMRSIRTEIGNDVWIGDNAVIIKGKKIGNGSIIGAGSVVTRDVEPFSIVAGNPAKLIKKRFSPEIISQIEDSQWWNLSISDLKGVPFDNISEALELIKKIKTHK